MKIELVTHKTGEQIPMMLDAYGMPVVLPNEFILSRRSLSTNTLVRNLRELSVLYRWLEKSNCDLSEKLLAQNSFNEAELKGSLVEALRIDQSNGRISAVAPNTFNQRLTTIRQFLSWYMDVLTSQLPLSSLDYERLRERKSYLLKTLDGSFMSATPIRTSLRKGLNEAEVDFLLKVLYPDVEQSFGRDSAVKFRNYISVGLMLFCGLRPGELLSLRVEDVEVGAISAIKVERRAPDPLDSRRPRPQIKRNGRVIPIDNKVLAIALNDYIVTWREELESKSNDESDYLILNDEGGPLSQSSITQFFQLLRMQYAGHLPENLTAKSLRHTFSSRLERILRDSGMDEQRRREALALLRGDSSLESQDIYIAQEVEERAIKSLKWYQAEIISWRK
ncbi:MULTISPECIES: tyrosine-type recombinase/integrase [Enterobacteriaceae]|uniref:Integrase n=1 Tax=Enterobacter hormaechei TaxID=158836 RepID=A0AAP8GQW8_9ENTR|nr:MULTISPECIES: site-specific integrase [Enterobacteriaceae]EJR7282801.1 tyrosine-type recombinase/integrase [Citrobacter freundii]HAS1888363.1 integrase [Enterobacter hormaechei subsp. xiangfangensis]HAU5797148.1 integrase [Citrobacter amalonaticus]KVI92321.1 integrase [Enterobacter hormaechei subsp. steigerwaltii]MCA5535963.1 site-specific integrase [Klebsiella pneumoniae]